MSGKLIQPEGMNVEKVEKKNIQKDSSIIVENQFPLFNILLSECNPKDECSLQQTKDISSKIKSLDKQGQEIAYALIRVYSLRYSNLKILDIPYQGKKIDEKNVGNDTLYDISMDFKLLPSILKFMLEKFYYLHMRVPTRSPPPLE